MIDTLPGLLFGTPIGQSALVALTWCTAIGVLWPIKALSREQPSGQADGRRQISECG
jgi:hypothetical protein